MPEGAEHIILSRTDSIGDVMLTLPMAGLLKQRFPKAYITFLAREYTVPVLERCVHIDRIITLEQLTVDGDRGAIRMLRTLHADAFVHVFPVLRIANWAAAAGIPHRIGTSRRWWHWLHCNHRIPLSRRKSDLHEAQLNVKLLAPFGITGVPGITELANWSGFHPPAPDAEVKDLFRNGKRKLILHPLSSGSAVEWGLKHFAELIRLVHPAEYQIFMTGTALEAEQYRQHLPLDRPNVTDVGGKLDLRQLIALIGASDVLVAASTGPLHIAAACGLRTIGLYANVRPIHPGRWAPIGKHAYCLAEDDLETTDPQQLIHAIKPGKVLNLIEASY